MPKISHRLATFYAAPNALYRSPHNLHPEADAWLNRYSNRDAADRNRVDVSVNPPVVKGLLTRPELPTKAKPIHMPLGETAAVAGAAIFTSSCNAVDVLTHSGVLMAAAHASIVVLLLLSAPGIARSARRAHNWIKYLRMDREERFRWRFDEMTGGSLINVEAMQSAFPEAEKVLSKKRTFKLFLEIARRGRRDAHSVYRMVPGILEKLEGKPPKEIMGFFYDVGDICRDGYPTAVSICNNALGMLPANQTLKLLKNIWDGPKAAKEALIRSHHVFLNASTRGFIKGKLSPDQIVEIAFFVAMHFGGDVDAARAVSDMLERHSYDKTFSHVQELADILESAEIDLNELIDCSFRRFSTAVEGAREVLSVDQAKDLIVEILRSSRRHAGNVLPRLVGALEEAERHATPEQITVMFKRMARGSTFFAHNAFEAFPLLAKKFSIDEIDELLKQTDQAAEKAGLSPTGYAVLYLYRLLMLQRDQLNPDLAEERLIEELVREGETARSNGLPTLGGKIGGENNLFDEGFFSLLSMLGFTIRNEIIGEEAGDQQMIILPAARSSYEAALLIDLLREVGVFRDGGTFRHQITLSGKIKEEAKYIALALHSAHPFPVPYPERLPIGVRNFYAVAPIAEGGGVLDDINGTMNGSTDRFDIPLMRIFTLRDPVDVLKRAAEKREDDRSLMEEVLLQLYQKTQALWTTLPKEHTLHGVSDEALKFLMVGAKDDTGFVIPAELERPDLSEQFVKALETVYGEDLYDIGANHAFTIYVSQLFTWALKSPKGSKPRKIYSRFKRGMRSLFRKAEIEDVLDVRWMKVPWRSIYPSLAKFESAETPAFRKKVRSLILETAGELRGELSGRQSS